MNEQKEKTKKATLPLEGLGIALGFLFLAFIFYFYPRLIGWPDLVITIFQLVSAVCLFISIAGAGVELAKLVENDAWNNLGIGLAFSAFAAILFIWMERSSISGNLRLAVEVIVLTLIVLFSFMISMALPSLLITIKRPINVNQQDRKKVIYGSIITGLLSTIVLILQLVNAAIKIKNVP